MNAYGTIFSEENLIEYSKACIDIALDLTSRDFDGLLIPSRGAFPFFIGIANALNELGKNHEDYDEFNKTLNLPQAIKRYVKDPNFGKGNGKRNVLLIPFTADLNLEGIIKGVDETAFVSFTRNYWSQVTSNFLLDPEERRKDPHFTFFTDYILRGIENRELDAKAYENFPKINKLAMIDTVISGRASSTILECLKNLAADKNLPGLLPYTYLIVDANGYKLKSPFKESLNNYIYSGKGSFHKISRIISEDEGAAFEGVAAIVYPTIMKKSMNLKRGEDIMFIGAGSWDPVTEIPLYNETFSVFSNLVHSGVKYVLSKGELIHSKSSEEKLRQDFEKQRAKLINLITDDNKKVFCYKDNFNDIEINLAIEKVYETSSHVVHILNKGEEVDKLLEKFASSFPNLRYTVDKSTPE